MEALVAAGADVALGAVDNMTALHFAAKKGADCVACLLAAGAPLDAACERTGKTALHIAAAAANGPVIEALISAGANRALKTRKGETARDLVSSSPSLSSGERSKPFSSTWRSPSPSP